MSTTGVEPTRSREFWQEAFDRMLKHVETTARTVRTGFPHYGDPATGAWTLSENGDWTGGFWVGKLWLAYHATKDERFLNWALQWANALRPRARSETVFRCFLFYYGAALGDILAGNHAAAEIGVEGARGLATLFNHKAKLIPLGATAEEASDVGEAEANVDGLQASALLAWAARKSGDTSLDGIAADYAIRALEVFVRPDHSVCQSASIDRDSGRVLRLYTHKGYRDDSTWTRAQAWAMVGATVDAIWLPEHRARLIAAARPIADWWLSHVPADRVSYWDFDAPQGGDTKRDTSGTAIATAALLKLAAVCDDAADRVRYRQAAEATAAALVTNYLTPAGVLSHGCYNHRIGLATQSQLIWGSYYLFEALCVLTGALEPARI